MSNDSFPKPIIAYDSSGRIIVAYDDVNTLVGIACDKVIAAKYSPDAIVGISSGGLAPARMAKCFFDDNFHGDIPIYVIGLHSYNTDKEHLSKVALTQTLDSDLEAKIAKLKILLVDEVDDSRRTLEKACDYLVGLKAQKLNILVVHSKIKEKAGVIPENVKMYCGAEVPDAWIVYPWH